MPKLPVAFAFPVLEMKRAILRNGDRGGGRSPRVMPPAAYQVVGRALRVGSRGRFLGCNFETNTALLSRDNGLMMRADEDTASDGTVDISVEYQDRTEVIRCRQGQSILEAVEASGLWDEVPSSCRAGVCTTCAAWLLSGEVDDPYAAIDPSIRQQGFILTCSSTPKPDSGPVCVRLGAYDFVYELQYGRFEKTS